MSPSRIRRAVVMAFLTVAATVLPVRMAWSLPESRLDAVPVTPGVVTDLPWPASHLVVRWTGEPGDAVAVRWRSAAGADWSGWLPVAADADMADVARGRQYSSLIAAPSATQVDLRASAGSPSDVEVVDIDVVHGPRHLEVAQATPAASAAATDGAVATPTVVTRAQWGADESLRHGTPSFAPIVRMDVHHTATANDDPDPAATIRAIYAFHTGSTASGGRGWDDIAYNFLVDSTGRIYEGRYARTYAAGETPSGESLDGQGVIGAHTLSNNPGTVGVALLGTFTDVAPRPAAVGALQRLLAWQADRHNVDPLGTATWTSGQKSTIIGHQDAENPGYTECPGAQLEPQLPAIRQAVASIVNAAHKTTRTTTTGYWILGRDTGLYSFGDAGFYGGAGQIPAPAMSMAPTRTGLGYWLLSASGRVSAYGDAVNYGSTEGMRLNAPAVRLEPTRTGRGYWIQAADGGIFSFGDAAFYGSTGGMKLNSPVISMSATPSGNGYWLLAGDGGVFTFGDGAFYGSTGDMKLNAPVVSMAPNPTGRGYWLQAADGGIFSFGDVGFYGSVPGLGLRTTAKTVQIRSTPTGKGYYVMAADGGIFTFGDAVFYDAHPGLSGATAAVDIALKTA
jgi:hypothetical protein